MKNRAKKTRKPTKCSVTVLSQISKLIPRHLVPKLARKHGVDKKARTFSTWSHVLTMMYTHLAHASGLNDVCDALRSHGTLFTRIREAVVPKRNTLSHANQNRDAAMAEELFWTMLDHLQKMTPRFGGRTFNGMPRRFKRAIYAIDSSTIKLVANCVDWAKHRRRKAAAKLHLQLDLRSYLPSFAIIDTAKHSDPRRAWELCANLKDGEIAVFDKAYVDFKHLMDLTRRGVFWVTRAKDNMDYSVKRRSLKKPCGNILQDDLIVLAGKKTKKHYDEAFRLVRAIVEVDGKPREMTFITNNTTWASSSVADLYKCRWSIETFFKEIKQTLQLSNFLGYSKNAVLWQVWTALLVYVLLRYQIMASKWDGGFKRFYCLLRSSLWSKYDIDSLVELCGTACGPSKDPPSSPQRFLPGFEGYFHPQF